MVAEHFPEDDFDTAEFEDYPHHLTVDEAQDLADAYCIDNETMRVCKEEYDLAHDEWMSFRQVHSLRHSQPTVVDPKKSIDEAVEHLSQRQRRQATERKAKQAHRRDRDKAARRWWNLENAVEEACERFAAEDYDPPRLKIQLSERPPQEAAVVANVQDYHVGVRPQDTEGFTVEGYCDRLANAFSGGLERAARNARLERIYLVVGGDLVHVDTDSGTTTAGTPQDLAVTPSQALSQAIELMARHVDLARQVASEVRLVGLTGNHDRLLSHACFEALRQRYRNTEEVTATGTDERVYETYGRHLLVMTHGDYSKKKMRRFQDVINAEARDLLSETDWTTVYTGHLHHKAQDLKDKAGRLHIQASSPSPDDDWHRSEAHVGARKRVQLHMLEPETPTDTTFSLAA